MNKKNECKFCGVIISPTATTCEMCNVRYRGPAEVNVHGSNSNEVLEVASQLQKNEHEKSIADQDIKLVRTLLLGVFLVSVLFSFIGVVLVYLGSTEAMDISIFGQKISSTGPGIASTFLGAVLVGTTGKKLFKFVQRK